ncbi:sugar ABC transporter ATP-binding protein [Bacillus sp. FJAT-50079]|uniref:sugar ABC transporter ATP-binding protein n=1 Tax=Bacillus sp. FJAT-50079 TaxID=2833577 RepID=UPI001BC918C5|nr:sugar ABC transporter ATP-binding protein [Bacillus sp. FJAT-50079]MBS4207528.1 sugar ABC transporter ATP-binding protein [Bacillus sp. FJAT-50079]
MDYILEMVEINKSFPGVKALQNVSLNVKRGEILGLIGENGAGKSTLMKILSGAYDKDCGIIKIDGLEIKEVTPKKMIDLGIAVIYQEMILSPNLSVAENIFLGRLPKTKIGKINWEKLNNDAIQVLAKLGLELDPSIKIKDLSVADRQMIEISKALSRDAKIIVLDEPTAVLGDAEVKKLFNVVRKLSEEGISFIYISHRLVELFELTSRVTVLKDGQHVGTKNIEDLSIDRLVTMMVGREVSDIYPKRNQQFGEIAIEVNKLTRKGILTDISLTVRKGEILGIAGLAGSGRTEILRAIFGADSIDSGEIKMNGKIVKIKSPREAIKLGLGFLTEERKVSGLFLHQPGYFNVSVSSLSKVKKFSFINPKLEKKITSDWAKEMDVRPPNVKTHIGNFSGGNQQKFMFARWLFSGSNILLVDEPTRGVDVGAKKEIYRILAELAEKGVAIVMVSSELPEILGMSDKILIMKEGMVAGEMEGQHATEEKIMALAAN